MATVSRSASASERNAGRATPDQKPEDLPPRASGVVDGVLPIEQDIHRKQDTCRERALLRRIEFQVVEPKHVAFDCLGVGTGDLDRQFVLTGREVDGPQREDFGYHAVVDQVDRLAERLAVDRKLNDTIVARFRESGLEVVLPRFGDRKSEC